MTPEQLLKILIVLSALVALLTCASCFNHGKNSLLPEETVFTDNIRQALNAPSYDRRYATALKLTKKELRKIIDDSVILNTNDPVLHARYGKESLRIITSLDPALQESINRRIARSTARQVAVVVLDPTSGRIITMAGFDREKGAANPCTSRCFPAASIFKMVTAAAAIEDEQFTPETTLLFNGRKHTLYKAQLKKNRNRYTNRISLRDSFAQSVNPVFGKIGIYALGRKKLEKYALSFGFSKHFDFELPVEESHFQIKDEPFNIAEVACGFNRETVITPLHGALITTVAVNQGNMMEPALVDAVEDSRGHIIYQNTPELLSTPISANAASSLKNLLEATVKRGTARRAFHGWRRDRVLSRLIIGGKTGTIDSTDRRTRYDWFCGFAEERNRGRKIVVAVLVAHAKPKLDVKAARYARFIIRDYFSGKTMRLAAAH